MEMEIPSKTKENKKNPTPLTCEIKMDIHIYL